MNYYSHHIGDFDRATRHLTRIERSVYLDLMFTYYDTEQPLTCDIAALCRKIVARGEEEKSAVLAVLDEFFTSTPAGWYHDRCEEELDAYRKSNTQKSAAGKASAAARAQRREQAINGTSTTVPTSVERTSNGTPTNQEPRTRNQEPETKTQKSKASATGSRLPAEWKPTPSDIEYCKTERPELRPSLVATNFYDYWTSKAGAAGRKVDWSATWRMWVRKEKEENAGRGHSPMPQRGGQIDLDEQRRKNNEEAKRLLGFSTSTPEDDERTIDV